MKGPLDPLHTPVKTSFVRRMRDWVTERGPTTGTVERMRVSRPDAPTIGEDLGSHPVAEGRGR